MKQQMPNLLFRLKKFYLASTALSGLAAFEWASRPQRRWRFQSASHVGIAAVVMSTMVTNSDAYASAAVTEIQGEIQSLDNMINQVKQTSAGNSTGELLIYALEFAAGGKSAKYRWTVNEINAGTLKDPLYGTINPLGTNGNNTLTGSAVTDVNGVPIAVGQSQRDSGGPHAFMWTLAGGTVDLGVLTINGQQATASNALGISANGSVIVGSSGMDEISGNLDLGQGPVTHAFRYTVADGVMRDLGTLPVSGFGASIISTANAANADGSVVVGTSTYGNVADNLSHAFRWVLTPGTETGVMTDIDGRAGTNSTATAVNAVGSVVVGSAGDSASAATTSAFYWTQNSGMVLIGRLPGLDTYASANGVSDDGSIIVGTSSHVAGITLDQTAFRWTQATGVQNLNTLLTNAGVNLTGITLETAVGVTSDGQFIAGNGQFADGQNGYIVRYCDATNMAACTGAVSPPPPPPPPVSPPPPPPPPPPPVAGMTTAASVQASVDQVAAARRMILIQEFGEAAQLLGANERIGSGSEIGVFAAGGTDDSLDGGAAGRIAYGNGLSVLAGLAGGEEHYGRVHTDATFMGALAVRYIYDTGSAWRPYGEAGAWGVPGAAFTFTRTYANGAGTSAGTSTVSATKYYAYGRLGATFTPDTADEIALSAEIGHGALHTGGFAESFSAIDPFQASGSSATDETTVGKLRLQWTHAFTATIDATLWGAAANAFDDKTTFAAGVPGFGLVTPTHLGRPGWAEYGGRIGYKITPATVVDIYADGVSGDQTIGTDIRVGAGVRYTF